jgi:hypothetical protein
MDTTKLVVGQYVRAHVQQLSDGEIAGRIIEETFNPGSSLSPVEDILPPDNDKKK